MNFAKNYFDLYFNQAPLALARERTTECYILSKMDIQEPVLDLGCGEGLFGSIFFSTKVSVGIDPNPREIVRAREFDCYKTLICCTGDSVPLPNESIKTILSNSTLEHIQNLEPVLKEMSRILMKDGTFLLTVPSDEFYKATFLYLMFFRFFGEISRNFYHKKYNQFWKHFHDYKPESWADLFHTNGWTVESMQRYNSRSDSLINDLLVPFALLSFLNKKIFNKWIIFPTIRKQLARLISSANEQSLKKSSRDDKGTLILFKLRKN